MNNSKLLQVLLILGGIVEIAIGLLFLVLDQFFKQIGIENIPIFTQIAGTFILCYGILLIYSSHDIEKLVFIPLINILARFLMIIFSLISIIKYPEFSIILIIAIPYDLIWSLIVLILLKKQDLIFRKNN